MRNTQAKEAGIKSGELKPLHELLKEAEALKKQRQKLLEHRVAAPRDAAVRKELERVTNKLNSVNGCIIQHKLKKADTVKERQEQLETTMCEIIDTIENYHSTAQFEFIFGDDASPGEYLFWITRIGTVSLSS